MIEQKKNRKVEGQFYNGREMGEWVFYGRSGEEVKRGFYEDGLPNGYWVYHYPFLDTALVWNPTHIDSFELSLPKTFKLRSPSINQFSFTFVDTIYHTVVALSLIDSCNQKCIERLYQDNLNGFSSHGNKVIYSQSTVVKAKKGDLYVDKLIVDLPDYQNKVCQYMLYQSVGSDKVVVLTVTNHQKFDLYLKFLADEVFYHLRYNYNRIAFPYDDLLFDDNEYN